MVQKHSYSKLAIGGAGCFFLLAFLSILFQSSNYAMRVKLLQKQTLSAFQTTYCYKETGTYTALYYTSDGSNYKDVTLRSAEWFFPLIAETLGYQWNGEKMVFLLHSSKEPLSQYLQIEENSLPLGAYDNGVVHILSPDLYLSEESDAQRLDDYLESGPIVHEITHWILDQQLEGHYPSWFTEGVALYIENKFTGFTWRQDLEQQANSLSLSELETNFEQLDEMVSYRKSFDIINQLVEAGGENKLRTTIKKMKKGADFQTAVQ